MDMASHQNHAFILSLALFLVVISTAPYAAQAQGNLTLSVNAIGVSGTIFCSNTGNLLPLGFPPPLPLVGANVNVSCNAGPSAVVSVAARTNILGAFAVTLTPNANVSLDLRNSTVLPGCFAVVQLPVQGCAALPSTGVIRAAILAIGLSGGLLGGGLVGAVGVTIQAKVSNFTVNIS